MNLNDIKLTPQQLADLYTNVLVETNSMSMPEKENVPFLGNNKRNILVLVSYPDVPFLPDEQLTFLINVLSACNLNLTDVAIVNKSKTDVHYRKLSEHLESKTILLFDVTPLDIDLPINFPQFQIQHFSKMTFLYVPSLNDIETDKELKKKLWISLKKIFEI